MASEQKNRDRSRSRDRGHDRAHSNRSEPPSATSNRYDPRYPPPPRRLNFSLLAALHCGIWRPNGPSNQNEEMPWMAKPFEFNGYDDYAIKIVEALRGMASGTVDMNKNFFADEWNHVFATPRMLKLIELIKKYQDEGEFEEDAIVEAILNESRDGEDIEMIDKSEKSPNTNQKKSTKENKKSTKENQKKKQKRNTKPKNNKKSTNGTGAKKNNRREPRPAARRA
eukprot:299459_1